MARFAREAQLIAKLDHPNVVRIVDVDVNATGFFYIVVELVEGRSLGEHRTRFGDARWALRVLGQLADGLAAIHAAGIMHRDLKPGNVLVTESPRSRELSVRIADFGIAGQAGLHDLGPGGSAIPSGDELLLTTTGMWIGTPRYMAPELADGAKKADRPSDVFAFGLIAYEVLTGSLPYEGSAALRALKGETYAAPPSIRARCPMLDVAIADVIDRCLLADPEARPLARAVADAFARYASEGGA
jgi:serine/threonine protein kinase